jgi:hypothetical protein
MASELVPRSFGRNVAIWPGFTFDYRRQLSGAVLAGFRKVAA